MKALAFAFWIAAAACAVLAVTQLDDMREQARVAEAAMVCAETWRPGMPFRVCPIPNPVPAITVWAGAFWAVLLALLGALPWRMATQAKELRELRLRVGSIEGEATKTKAPVRGLSADAIAAADRVGRG